MLHAIGVIARARLLIGWNTFWRGKLIRKTGTVALALILALGGWGLYWLMNVVVRGLRSPQFAEALAELAREQPELNLPGEITSYIQAVPSLALFIAFLMLVFTSFSAVLVSLYLSGDMDMLLAAPVPMRAVFTVKFFGGLATPYLLLFTLLCPALVGFGHAMQYGPAYYAMLVVALALLPLLPAGIGALLVMVVVRVVPARRAREIVGVLGALLGVGWYVFSQFAPSVTRQIANIQTLESLRQLQLPILPTTWGGRALLAAGEGAWLTLLVYGGLFVALSVGVFAGCLVLAEQLYFAGWSNMATQGGRARRPEKRGGQASAGRRGPLETLLAPLPAQSRAIALKDLRVFPRDLRNLQAFIFPLAVAGIWTFQLLQSGAPEPGPAGSQSEAVADVLRTIGPAGISFFVCMTLSSALGGPSISREGRGYWLLQAAPVSPWRLLLGKLAVAYLPYPLLGTLFVAILTVLQRAGLAGFVQSLGLVLLLGLGFSAITLGLGAAFPRFDWEHPNQQTSMRSGCLNLVLYMLYFVLGAGAVLGLPALSLLMPTLLPLLVATGWVVLLGLTALVTWGMLALGASRLERVEI